jgi:hypothetical protein
MRSVTHLKVEGHETLKRDMSSNAIINDDDTAYRAYVSRRELEKRQREEFLNLKDDVQGLKDDIKDIKELLLILAKGKQ